MAERECICQADPMDGRRVVVMHIRGPFTEAELSRFAAVLREIDAARPKETFTLTIADPFATMDEADAVVRRMLPPLPERATEFARRAYQDDSFAERECDRCGARYRGPAVYCSLACAIRGRLVPS